MSAGSGAGTKVIHVHLHLGDVDLSPITDRLTNLEAQMSALTDQIANLTQVVTDFETLTTELGTNVHAAIEELKARIDALGVADPALQANLDKLAEIGDKLELVNAEAVGAMLPAPTPEPVP